MGGPDLDGELVRASFVRRIPDDPVIGWSSDAEDAVDDARQSNYLLSGPSVHRDDPSGDSGVVIRGCRHPRSLSQKLMLTRCGIDRAAAVGFRTQSGIRAGRGAGARSCRPATGAPERSASGTVIDTAASAAHRDRQDGCHGGSPRSAGGPRGSGPGVASRQRGPRCRPIAATGRSRATEAGGGRGRRARRVCRRRGSGDGSCRTVAYSRWGRSSGTRARSCVHGVRRPRLLGARVGEGSARRTSLNSREPGLASYNLVDPRVQPTRAAALPRLSIPSDRTYGHPRHRRAHPRT